MSSQPGRSRRKARPPAPGSRNRNPATQPPASSDQPDRDETSAGGFTFTPGIVVLGIGAFLILLAFSVLAWFRNGPGFFSGASDNSRFGDLHKLIARYKAQTDTDLLRGRVSFGFSEFYFGWLGWLLFLAAVGFGALAVSRFGARHWYVRWFACVVAVGGAALSLVALNLITFEGNAENNANAPSFGDYFAHSGLAAWAAILGFVLIAIAVFLPRRDA
jgi:hypothetical protein